MRLICSAFVASLVIGNSAAQAQETMRINQMVHLPGTDVTPAAVVHFDDWHPHAKGCTVFIYYLGFTVEPIKIWIDQDDDGFGYIRYPNALLPDGTELICSEHEPELRVIRPTS